MSQRSQIHLVGTVTSADQLTQKLVPFLIPIGTTYIHVKYSYTGQSEGNAIDLGLLTVGKRFRGYSGGSKFEVFVANDDASPGYTAGLLEPGEWHVLLGVYNVNGTADYEIDIDLDNASRPVFEPNPAPTRADFSTSLRRRPGERPILKWLKGDFHMHTVHSDGQFTLDELVDKACKRGLDFIFSTEHNTFSANLVWGKHVPPGFLVGRGIEVTTLGGHWNAIGLLPSQNVDPHIHDLDDMDGSLSEAVKGVHAVDGLAILNHPYAECKCCDWTYSFHDCMDAIEVWNGPWKRHPKDESNVRAVEKWDSLLREGRVFAASGGSDIHEHRFEIGEPCTKILAEDLSADSLIRALRERHAYITQHPEFEIDFFLAHGEHKAGIGDWLEGVAGKEVEAIVAVQGFPPSDFEIRLVTDKGLVHRSSEASLKVNIRADYVRVEVRNVANDMLGLTNPIWVL